MRFLRLGTCLLLDSEAWFIDIDGGSSNINRGLQ
jgi:hypothetical protein